MECKNCGKLNNYSNVRLCATRSYASLEQICWLACHNCENVLHEPPEYIPQEQKVKYLIKSDVSVSQNVP